MLPLPHVHGVRLAELEDLPRISIVAAASFFWSPTFKFQRPRFRDFPEDTLASYYLEYEQAIRDPACLVLVAEDLIKEDEVVYAYEALQFAYTAPPAGHMGIVGVCSIQLRPGSFFLGRFQAASGRTEASTSNLDMDTSTYGEVGHGLLARHALLNLRRDQSDAAVAVYNSQTQPAKLRHLVGASIMRLSTLAVSPAYWRRGHATRLVDYCTQLADSDDAILGVSATPRGKLVVAKVGFQERETIRISGTDYQSLTDVELWIAVRSPCAAKSPAASKASMSGVV